MPDSSRLPRLLIFSAATFHASFLFVVLVLLVHLAGGLGDLLAGLSTEAGFGLFGAFWLTTWWTTRRALRGINWAAVRRLRDIPRKAGRALGWGALNGLLFFWVLLAFLFVANLLAQGGLQPGFLSFLLFAALAGSAIALAVGAVIGLLFAMLDAAVLAAVWGRWSNVPEAGAAHGEAPAE